MPNQRIGLVIVLLIMTSYANATEICSTLLSYGIKDNFSVLTTDESFSLYQNSLCNEEYSNFDKFSSGIRSHNFSATTVYGIFGLSGSSNKMRSEFNEKYSNFCSSTLDTSNSRSKFISKKSIISNNLTRAFNVCVGQVLEYQAKEEIPLYIAAVPQANFTSFTVHAYRNTTLDTQITNIEPSSVTCYSGGNLIRLPFEINTDKFALGCTKPAKSLVSFSIGTAGEGPSNVITIPADMDRLSEMESRLEDLEYKLKINTPQNIIVAVASDSCPDGWEDYAPAYGRFLRGIDKSNQGIDPDGIRPHGTLQADIIKTHQHNYVASGRRDKSSDGGREDHAWGAANYTTSANTGAGTETRPKNVALLYCKKK
jgi:hypothetical protein